ncbi:TipAS antibiotic-recognition domain-containing protein [Lactobacillus acetotolerans]|uniref:TipAS antibiotic-recognition domain-containing protein n=1 Tax=Lactobacillus acetotolerans TaxID=1600 RepID=UPI0007B9999A|nr:TipAS antibiotic-recognition domain-containing protein [Lactobacillus acetotolerans]
MKIIKAILDEPNFDIDNALQIQIQLLQNKRQNLDKVISNVRRTIKERNGKAKMSDEEKFNGLKKDSIKNNEKKYGKEIRQKYGERAVNASNKHVEETSKKRYDKLKETETDLVKNLETVLRDPSREDKLSDQIFRDHQTWLQIVMPNYSPKLHLSIIKLYETEPRFQDYYDHKAGKGATKILVKAVKEHLNK